MVGRTEVLGLTLSVGWRQVAFHTQTRTIAVATCPAEGTRGVEDRELPTRRRSWLKCRSHGTHASAVRTFMRIVARGATLLFGPFHFPLPEDLTLLIQDGCYVALSPLPTQGVAIQVQRLTCIELQVLVVPNGIPLRAVELEAEYLTLQPVVTFNE